MDDVAAAQSVTIAGHENRLWCIDRARSFLASVRPPATDDEIFDAARALDTFIGMQHHPDLLAREALKFGLQRSEGALRSVDVPIERAKRFLTFVISGQGANLTLSEVVPKSPDAGDELPLVDDVSLLQGVGHVDDGGQDRCSLFPQGVLDPVGAGIQDRNQVLDVGRHDVSSVGGMEASTVGESGRVGNDPAAGDAGQ